MFFILDILAFMQSEREKEQGEVVVMNDTCSSLLVGLTTGVTFMCLCVCNFEQNIIPI